MNYWFYGNSDGSCTVTTSKISSMADIQRLPENQKASFGRCPEARKLLETNEVSRNKPRPAELGSLSAGIPHSGPMFVVSEHEIGTREEFSKLLTAAARLAADEAANQKYLTQNGWPLVFLLEGAANLARLAASV